ncbi:MAG: hypothetical protein FJX64_03655 [Alphaproteobacteria bacterium]|nr:hypothetical protein [Alphaproteobacteria bacterium]
MATALTMLLVVGLGGPLLWGFAFSGLGILTWLVAAFGWLPGDFFASNFSLLSRVAAAVAAPLLIYVGYRLAFRVYRVEVALARDTSSKEGPTAPAASAVSVTATAPTPGAPAKSAAPARKR